MNNLIFVIDTLERGGKERRLVELIKQLSLIKDFNLFLVVLNGKVLYDEVLSSNVFLYRLDYNGKNSFNTIRRLHQILYMVKPSIIHCWSATSSLFILPFLLLNKVFFINGMISTAPSYIRPFSNLWIKAKLSFFFSNIIVANTYAGLKAFKVPESKRVCIHNGFDYQRIKDLNDPFVIKSNLNLNNKFVVGMVANFTDNKDYWTLILAAKCLERIEESIVFLCIGDGPNFHSISNLLVLYNIKNVKLLGRISDVESYINIFDIGILLTNTKVHGEGISNSILECLALGKPVIATDCPGSSEIVRHNVNGFLISPQNNHVLIDFILILFNDYDKRIDMGLKSQEIVKNEFSIKKSLDAYINVYKKFIR